jgi:FixJ family two-component response regulator
MRGNMESKAVLIVDDEKNIRLTLAQALESLNLETQTAASGDEALAKLKDGDFGLILLDIRMPEMDGMEVLRRVREVRPDIRVIMITAYGTIEFAVEAIKLGAVDFLQKPFDPGEIRELVSRVLDRDKLSEKIMADYASHLELSKRCITDRHFESATEHLRQAISLDPSRPEAFNLLGCVMEIRGEREEAQKNYRTALSIDPSYAPAITNLQRSTETRWRQSGRVVWDEPRDEKKNPEQ